MASDPTHTRQCRAEGLRQVHESVDLKGLIGLRIASLELDPNRKIIAIVSATKVRPPGMPCTRLNRHVLRQTAASINDKMGRDLHATHSHELRVRGIEGSAQKKVVHMGSAVRSLRQTNTVHHKQFGQATVGPFIEKRRIQPPIALLRQDPAAIIKRN